MSSWADAGLPGNVTLRPWGKVLYVLMLGLQELALAMGVDLTEYESWVPPDYDMRKFENIRDRFNYANAPLLRWDWGNPNSLMAYFDSIFRPLVYSSFRAKYCLEHLVYECSDEQMFGEISSFLGEDLIHAGYDYVHSGELSNITGAELTVSNGVFPRWVEQRYRLIHDMPIYAPYGRLAINSHLDNINTYYFRSGRWTGKIGFQRTWSAGNPGGTPPKYGYWAWYNWNGNTSLIRLDAIQTAQPDFPFKVQFLHRASVNGSDFGTGLRNGQIWTEEIAGFGSHDYSYAFPSGDGTKYIGQETQIFIRVTPQNNPWITGGIHV